MTQTSVTWDAISVLQKVVDGVEGKGDRPSTDDVVAALLQAERLTKRNRSQYPFPSLYGQWRLCFTTGTRKVQQGGIRLGKGFYMPFFLAAAISFSPSEGDAGPDALCGTIGNQIRFGALVLKLTGSCRYVAKKNILVFDFTQWMVQIADRTLYQGAMRGGAAQTQAFMTQPITQLPFFAFFQVSDRWIAARGRGGGLALWVRETVGSP